MILKRVTHSINSDTKSLANNRITEYDYGVTLSKKIMKILVRCVLWALASCTVATVIPEISPAMAQRGNPEAAYTKAQQDLSNDFYTLYRIVDRIARANDLDTVPWRVQVLKKYDINAFATEVNLIGVYNGLLDQVAGDASALACVVGHEMAHHTERHIALSATARKIRREEISAQIEAEVAKEADSASSTVRTNNILGAVFGVNTSGFSRRTIRKAEERIDQIKKERLAEFEAEVLALSRKHEFEADHKGYIYMATAGFQPEGCLRVMEILSRLPLSDFDTTHPNVSARIQALKDLMATHPPSSLARTGQAKINSSRPLTYELSKDGVSLRVNSQFGTTVNDFERLFGQ